MNPIQKTVEYFRSAKAEMEKVSWPSKQDTLRYSSLVIGASVAIALFFATLDLGLVKLVDATLSARQTTQAQPSDINVTPVTPDLAPTVETDTKPAENAPVNVLDLKDAKPLETPKTN